jgi:hypothetical protein
MFNIAQSGNVVNIDSEDVTFDITVSLISGTAFQVANIEAIGYDWEVTTSVSGTVADISLIPRNHISGPCWGLSAYRKMLYVPWEGGQTMSSVGVTGSLTPTLLYSANVDLGWDSPKMQMTSDYVFLHVVPLYDVHIKRYSINDFSEQDYDPSTDNRMLLDSAVYSDNTIFTLEDTWDDSFTYDNFQICKVSYPTGTSSATGTTTTEVMYEWDVNNPIVDGIEYTYWDNYFFGRVKSGIYDCIVSIWTFLGESPQTYLWKIVIYNINTDTASEQWIKPSNEFDADLYNLPYGCTSPAFYNSKLIFTYSLIDLHDLPGPPYGSICLFPTLIIDISTNTVTLIDNYKFDLDADYTYTNVYHTTSVIDYTTGIYYFVVYIEPIVGSADTYIFSMNISVPSVTLGDSCSWNLEPHQGENQGYAIDETGAPANCDVITIPTQTIVANVDTLLAVGKNESLAAIDIPNDMIWNIKSSVLQGKTLGAGSDRDITVDWAGATIPFTYPSQQEVWIRILDGRCIVMIYSRTAGSPYSFQQDFYLLKET